MKLLFSTISPLKRCWDWCRKYSSLSVGSNWIKKKDNKYLTGYWKKSNPILNFLKNLQLHMEKENKTTGKVVGIVANLVMVEVDGPVAQNEICFMSLGNERLMAEVIKVVGKVAYVQVFESTR